MATTTEVSEKKGKKKIKLTSKSIGPRLGQCTSMRSKLYNFVSKAQFKIRCTNELFSDWLKDE